MGDTTNEDPGEQVAAPGGGPLAAKEEVQRENEAGPSPQHDTTGNGEDSEHHHHSYGTGPEGDLQHQQAPMAFDASLVQAHALQQQLQQHLQQLQPFPFAYQQAGLPVGVGLPAHLAGAGSAVGQSVGAEGAQQIKSRPKRKQVKSACLNCRKRKTGCDSFRPCTKCVRNGLESSCVDVPRKKRSSNRSKSNSMGNSLSNSSSSPSPSSSPALVPPQPSSSYPTSLPPHVQYMSVQLPNSGLVTQNGGPLSQQQYAPQLIPMTWGPSNGAAPQLVPMTWEEITKHVASATAQSSGIPSNLTLAALPPEIAWKNEGGHMMQSGPHPLTHIGVEQSK